MTETELFIQLILNGVTIGSYLALIALGYTRVAVGPAWIAAQSELDVAQDVVPQGTVVRARRRG